MSCIKPSVTRLRDLVEELCRVALAQAKRYMIRSVSDHWEVQPELKRLGQATGDRPDFPVAVK